MGCLPGLEEKHLGALISPSIVQLFSASTNRWPTCTEKMPATSATETAGIFHDAAEELARDVDAPHISLKLEQSDELCIPEAPRLSSQRVNLQRASTSMLQRVLDPARL